MPIFLRFNNYIEFLIQSIKIVCNMRNSIETRCNLSTELGSPVGVQDFGTGKNFSFY